MSDCPVCHLPETQHHMSCYAARAPNQENGPSPWRSLKDDPPTQPSADTVYAVLVRKDSRWLTDDRYRLLVPYQDSDNGNCWRWFESHLDYVMEDLIEHGYSVWMEIPD